MNELSLFLLVWFIFDAILVISSKSYRKDRIDYLTSLDKKA